MSELKLILKEIKLINALLLGWAICGSIGALQLAQEKKAKLEESL